MTPPQSSGLFTSKRFVIWGKGTLGRVIHSVLTQWAGPNSLDFVSGERPAQELLWEAGDNHVLFDKTHLIFASDDVLRPQQLFSLHCRFRPNSHQNGTLQRIGPGWSGGILFIGPTGHDAGELTNMAPFHRLGGGHAVQGMPFRLVELLQKTASLQPLYPHAWRNEVDSLDGLQPIRDVLAKLSSSNASSGKTLSDLSEGLKKLLRDKVLEQLLAHSEVIGQLREKKVLIDRAIDEQKGECATEVANDIRSILIDYL